MGGLRKALRDYERRFSPIKSVKYEGAGCLWTHPCFCCLESKWISRIGSRLKFGCTAVQLHSPTVADFWFLLVTNAGCSRLMCCQNLLNPVNRRWFLFKNNWQILLEFNKKRKMLSYPLKKSKLEPWKHIWCDHNKRIWWHYIVTAKENLKQQQRTAP